MLKQEPLCQHWSLIPAHLEVKLIKLLSMVSSVVSFSFTRTKILLVQWAEPLILTWNQRLEMRMLRAAPSLASRLATEQNLQCTVCPTSPPASRPPGGSAESWGGSPPLTWIHGSWPPTDSWVRWICAASETSLADGVHKRQSRKFLFSVPLCIRTGNSQQHFSNTHLSSFSQKRRAEADVWVHFQSGRLLLAGFKKGKLSFCTTEGHILLTDNHQI